MKPELFFDPIDFVNGDPTPGTLEVATSFFNGDEVQWKKADIAIFSVPEERGSISNTGCASGAGAVRKYLYNYFQGNTEYNLVDFGILRPGPELDDTYLRLKEVTEVLINENVIPIIIGGSHDLSVGQFLGYQDVMPYAHMVNVDSKIDIDDNSNEATQGFLKKILLHEPNYLLNYLHLGFQSYLVNQSILNELEKLNFEKYRLGQMREDFKEVEPIIRTADLLSFDISSIKSSDAPGNRNAQVFGLTAEEACQICWYAGQSHRLSSVGFYEYNPESDIDEKTANVLATMIWYFIDGYYNRKGDLKFDGAGYTKYVVDMSMEPGELVFFKHNLTEKWWLEIPYHNQLHDKKMVEMIPCSYSDFELANRGEIPDRWMLAMSRLS